jgi:ubiquinone/menaquinone biosynthesis C-methylase UbiE
MPLPHNLWQANNISNDDAVNSWNEAAQEFTSFFAEGEEFYHKYLINPTLLELLGDIEGKTILDLACGEGHLARTLAELTKSNIKIFGLDASANMVKIAAEKSQAFASCLTFQQADAADLVEFQADFFDLAVCNMALMDIKDYVQAIGEVARTLKAKGQFIFSILHPCFMTPQSGWVKDEQDKVIGWRVSDYYTHLAWKWTIKSKMKSETYYFHRTLEDYFAALGEYGFVVTAIREPMPSKELIEMKPRLVHNLQRADFLIVKSILLGQF